MSAVREERRIEGRSKRRLGRFQGKHNDHFDQGGCGTDGEHNGRLTQRINGENSIGPLQAIVRVLVYIL